MELAKASNKRDPPVGHNTRNGSSKSAAAVNCVQVLLFIAPQKATQVMRKGLTCFVRHNSHKELDHEATAVMHGGQKPVFIK